MIDHYVEAVGLCREFHMKRRRAVGKDHAFYVKKDDLERIADCAYLLDMSLFRGKPKRGTLLEAEETDGRALEAANAAGEATEVVIVVEWRASRKYGRNPTAHVRVSYRDGDGRSLVRTGEGKTPVASCGYDKASTAVCLAMRGIPELDRLVIGAGPEFWERSGIVKSPYPQFSFGGRGMETLRSLFVDGLGWRWDNLSAENVDVYVIRKEEGK